MPKVSLQKSSLALFLAVATVWWASPAQAGFSLYVTNDFSNDGFSITQDSTVDDSLPPTFTITDPNHYVSSWTADGNEITVTANVDGYDMTYTVDSNRRTGGPTSDALVSVASTIMAGIGASAAQWDVVAQDDLFTFPGTIGDTVHLFSTLSTGQVSDGVTVATRADYQETVNGNANGQYVRGDEIDAANSASSNQDYESSRIQFQRQTSEFSLAAVHFHLDENGVLGSGATFTGTAHLNGPNFVPEPSSLALIFIGAPLVGTCLWRRRRSPAV
jgi:hypothetical protein